MNDLLPAVLAGSPARILVRGLASLVEEMQEFAESFRLGQEQVFLRGCDAFRGRRAEEVLRDWIRSGDEGARRLQALLEDVADHQRAIIQALDEVAREAALQSGRMPSLARPLSWPSGNRHRADLMRSPALRREQVVLPALSREYARIRNGIPAGGEAKAGAQASRHL